MKVEQACRFRSDEGYGITGKSAGFDQAREKTLGELFNDSMSPIFPKLGTSVLTCAVRGPYAFYARNTYRSHGNREALFTHSYILPVDEYVRAMQQMPQRLLAVPISEFMSIQSCGMDMAAAEFPSDQYGELSLDHLIQKYNLTPGRYARLLMGAYEAMTSNRSLRLYTSRTIDDTEQIVRELVYCIVDGLMPAMKGRITFSSGADTRMNISVVHTGGKPAQSGDLIFGVEDDHMTNIRPRDDLSAAVFNALGSADHNTRRNLLEQMEDWLREITNVENGMSVMLISAAYCYCSGQKMSHDTQISLFRSFAKAAGKTVPMKIANALLTDLVQQMLDERRVSTKALSNIAEWYLMDSSEHFRRTADQALDTASIEICLALVNAAIQLPANSNVYELVSTLMRRVPISSPEMTEELRDQLIRWTIRENVNDLVSFCDWALESYSPAQLKELAEGILRDAQDKKLNDAQIAALMRAVDQVANSTGTLRFSDEALQLLDSHMEEFSDSDLMPIADYTLNVRLRDCASMDERVNRLMQMTQAYPMLTPYVEKAMTIGANSHRHAQLWENYQTRIIFTEDISGDQIPYLLRHHNTFKDPRGPFEKKAMSLWTNHIREQLASVTDATENSSILARRNDLAVQLLKQSDSLEVSAQMRNLAKQFTLNQFWELMTYDQIARYSGLVKLDHELREEVTHAQFKLPLWAACGRLMAKPDNAGDLVQLVKTNLLSAADQQDLQDQLIRLVYRLVIKYRTVVWDLILLHCWKGTDEYDFDLMYDRLCALQEWIDKKQFANVQSSAATSVLLMNAPLRKALIKKLDPAVYDVPEIAEALVNELRSGKRRMGRTAPDTGSQRSAGAQRQSAAKPEPERQPAQRGSNTSAAGGRTGSGYTPPFGSTNQGQNEDKGFLGGLFGKGRNRK